ncbi:fimbrial protein [Klebsiella aerogenes]|uniref:fimbrial protein n=1 Tax=Klebsiella aerogenes TaxID=548 RepID=UPI001905A22F|nr:fimbrial protein [Klebsiella aerogenes]MBK0469655.1 type 1 fimbrial protein [Klebsiella aerogenes]
MKSITILIAFVTSMILYSSGQYVYAGSANIKLSGSLVSEPCILGDGQNGKDITVDFGTIPAKNFYSIYSNRTWTQNFKIVLLDCDLTLGNLVKITFNGTEDAEQPGLLAITSVDGVQHIALGIESEAGIELPVNQETSAYTLKTGTTELNFMAYVQASEYGIKNKAIGFGNFNAVATFSLEYP